MIGSAAAVLRVDYDDYLAIERRGDARHEYLDGVLRAMSRGTTAHSLVKTNVLRAVGNALEGKPGLALDSDQRIDVAATGLDTYPDLSVTCGPIDRPARDRNAITNPTLVVEVISPSTEGHDLGFKRRHYQRIPSLRQIVYVWPDQRAVEVHTRGEEGAWIVRDAADETILLASIDAAITRSQLFARVDEVLGPDDVEGGDPTPAD